MKNIFQLPNGAYILHRDHRIVPSCVVQWYRETDGIKQIASHEFYVKNLS